MFRRWTVVTLGSKCFGTERQGTLRLPGVIVSKSRKDWAFSLSVQAQCSALKFGAAGPMGRRAVRISVWPQGML